MVLTGCRTKGRHTEQHDIFFGIATSMGHLIPALEAEWPDAIGKIHVDAWREVTIVNGHEVHIVHPTTAANSDNNSKLFFINLGGYQRHGFDELHYKMVAAAPDITTAIQTAKATDFYQQNTFKGAVSHIDDKFEIEIDEWYLVADLLPEANRGQYQIVLKPTESSYKDVLHIGYFKLDTFLK